MTDEAEILIQNPEVKYKEAWIREYVIFKLDDIILGTIRNPYWDWEGVMITPEEQNQLDTVTGEARRNLMQQIKGEQDARKARALQQSAVQSQNDGSQDGNVNSAAQNPAPPQPQGAGPQPANSGAPQAPVLSGLQPNAQGEIMPVLQNDDEAVSLQAYYFNHFDQPRKPYIFATIFNNENTPVGQTDMIEQATPLQESADEQKRNIVENARIVNGTILVDSGVMDKANAQKLRWEAGGIIWGKNVVAGVKRETGPALPAFVVQDMQDSRAEIDNIMASTDAFKGVAHRTETKAGRLALVDQSYLRLNELVQVTDYVCYELFNGFYQLAKTRYTEHHYAKTMGKDQAQQVLSIIQDDFENGAEVRIIAGKMLPEDREFKYEQAQTDVQKGFISVPDYLEIANYSNPKEKAKNAFMFRIAPATVVGLSQEDIQKIPPPIPQTRIAERIDFRDLPAVAKVQVLGRMGIQVSEQQVIAGEVSAAVLANAAKGMGNTADPNTEGRAEQDITQGDQQQQGGTPIKTAPLY